MSPLVQLTGIFVWYGFLICFAVYCKQIRLIYRLCQKTGKIGPEKYCPVQQFLQKAAHIE